jgi:hypothetical protein
MRPTQDCTHTNRQRIDIEYVKELTQSVKELTNGTLNRRFREVSEN